MNAYAHTIKPVRETIFRTRNLLKRTMNITGHEFSFVEQFQFGREQIGKSGDNTRSITSPFGKAPRALRMSINLQFGLLFVLLL